MDLDMMAAKTHRLHILGVVRFLSAKALDAAQADDIEMAGECLLAAQRTMDAYEAVTAIFLSEPAESDAETTQRPALRLVPDA